MLSNIDFTVNTALPQLINQPKHSMDLFFIRSLSPLCADADDLRLFTQ